MFKMRYLFVVTFALFAAVTLSPNAMACIGACCLPDNSCVEVVTEDECLALDGQVVGGSCADVVCGGPPLECRMTGGGVDTSGRWDGTMVDGADDLDRYTFGGQVGAPTASQPQPSGEWTHHQQRGPDGNFVFHAGTASAPAETRIAIVTCSDPGFCNPAREAPAKQIDYAGVGSFKNIRKAPASLADVVPGLTFHWFEVHVEDLGEPGKAGKVDPPADTCPPEGSAGLLADCDCPDFYVITIHANEDPTSDIIYQVGGYITGGNLQIHPPIQ
jgi:hypothetical protein